MQSDNNELYVSICAAYMYVWEIIDARLQSSKYDIGDGIRVPQLGLMLFLGCSEAVQQIPHGNKYYTLTPVDPVRSQPAGTNLEKLF